MVLSGGPEQWTFLGNRRGGLKEPVSVKKRMESRPQFNLPNDQISLDLAHRLRLQKPVPGKINPRRSVQLNRVERVAWNQRTELAGKKFGKSSRRAREKKKVRFAHTYTMPSKRKRYVELVH